MLRSAGTAVTLLFPAAEAARADVAPPPYIRHGTQVWKPLLAAMAAAVVVRLLVLALRRVFRRVPRAAQPAAEFPEAPRTSAVGDEPADERR